MKTKTKTDVKDVEIKKEKAPENLQKTDSEEKPRPQLYNCRCRWHRILKGEISR